jgi:hypothetical protein
MTSLPNEAAAVNAPTAFCCHAESQRRRVTDQRCWTKREFMRAVLVLVALCVWMPSARSNEVHVVHTCRTNESGSISTREIFTRAGRTNLVRLTTAKDGAVQIQVHRFYHDGAHVGDYVVMKDSSGFTTEGGCPYSVAIEFWPSKDVRSVVFGTNGIVIDAFMATNGVFCPADTAFIKRANDFGGDVGRLLSPSHVTTSTPESFRRDLEQFTQQHKPK